MTFDRQTTEQKWIFLSIFDATFFTSFTLPSNDNALECFSALHMCVCVSVCIGKLFEIRYVDIGSYVVVSPASISFFFSSSFVVLSQIESETRALPPSKNQSQHFRILYFENRDVGFVRESIEK